MKVLDLRSLGSLRSAEIEPGISIRLSSGAQSPENGYWRRDSLVHLAAWSSDDVWRVAVNEYETTRS